MNNYMITGSWDDITLLCGHSHDEEIEMEIREGPSSPFYACPKYYPENRKMGERACGNRLSLQDYTAMLQHLHKKLIEADLSNERINLTNYSWRDRKGTQFKVLLHSGDKMKILVENKRAINF